MRWLILTILLSLSFVAEAAPTARFTARPIQGATCVAPCAVHFDAIGKGYLSTVQYVTEETTDAAYSRPFHQLLFVWDFDDPSSGTWSTTGRSRNSATGAIAGHTYYSPGTYTVTLTVTNPVGETASITHDVTVSNPDAVFSGTTYCVANGVTPTPGANGCPSGATGINTSDLDVALNGNTNCNTDSAKVRCLFRGGDTFTANQSWTITDTGDSPGLIASYGTGRATFVQPADIFSGHAWTLYNLSIDSSAAGYIYQSDSHNFASIDVVATGSGTDFSCINPIRLNGDTEHAHLVAFVNFDCTADGTTANVLNWMAGRYVMHQGGTFDRNFLENTAIPPNNKYSMRFLHEQHFLLQHVRVQNVQDGGNCFHFRSIDRDSTGYESFTDDEMATSYLLVSDNQCYANNQGGENWVCADAGCRCLNGTCTSWNRVSNVLIERNYYRRVTHGTTSQPATAWKFEGGDFTVRNEVYDWQGGSDSGGKIMYMAIGIPTNGTGPSGAVDGNVEVYNNTYYNDDAVTAAITVLSSDTGFSHTGCNTNGCVVRNNLAVTEGDASSITGSSGSGTITASNNVRSSSNIFTATVPEQGLTSISDFIPASNDSVARNAGFSVITNMLDALVLCRPDATLWDIGALEYNAGSACLASGSTPSDNFRGGLLRGGTLR